MRVAVVLVEFPSVSETFILDHVEGLIRRGHEVTIIADRPSGSVPLPPTWGELALSERVVYRPSKAQPYTSLVADLGSTAGRIARSPLGLGRIISPSGRDKRQRLALARELVADASLPEVDLFHCHYGPLGLRQVDSLEVLASRTPVVTTFHGFDVTRYVDRHGADCYDRLWERGALFLPVSQLFRSRLIELGAPPERTIVHHMGVDVSAVRPGSPVQGQGRPLRGLTIGRLVEKKGVEWAIRAVATASAAGTDVTLAVIGDGPLRSSLAGLAKELDAPVEFLGSTDRPTVMKHLSESDVLIAPSVTSTDGDMEGIPVVVMEAMANGIPVISTDHSGIPEIVRNGESGLLSPERDVDSLASHLAMLATNTAERQRLGTGGRAMVEAEFSTEVLDDQLVELYRGVVAQPGRRPLPS